MLSFNSEKYLLSHENDCLNEISYTWKDSYCLPFETAWARIAKFSYLNGLSWSYVQQKTKLRHYICTQFEKEIVLNIPDFFLRKKNFEDFKICPECMKYGYQSVLHQIKGLDFCFLHKCSLITVSPKQLESSKYGTYEFIEIKTENLIKNIELYSLLQEYIEKIQKEQLLDTKFILPQSNNDSIIRPCSENTERLFHRMVLLQDEVEINNIYRKATQYIVFPIINDLFEDLTNQAYIMFKNAVIQLKPDNICELTPDIWRVPQYVVLYYRDRTEIYKCEPDEY